MRAIFYDTETTGVRARSDRIIEIAAYDPDRDKSYVALVNPGMPIPAEASAVHHITDEMVADKPSFEVIAQEFSAFCGPDAILVAHNNDGFDRHFIAAEYERAGVELPNWHYFDTLKWARRYRPDLPRHALQFLREVFGFEANTAHRALDDVMMLYQITCCMVDDLTIQEAYQLLDSSFKVTHMPFGKHRGKPLDEVDKGYLEWLKGSGALDKPNNADLRKSLEELSLI